VIGELPSNPFPGPVPFRDTDPIFGRDREIGELIDRLIADRLVLLYSPSGAGKSSMLSAHGGVLPQMAERAFRTHKPIRVGLEAPAGANRYVWSCATSLELPCADGQRLTEMLGKPADDLYVFDQFEEVLTADPTDQRGRLEFFKQLGEALRVHGRWAVFAIREDYLAPVDDYMEWLPTQLASRMRINILAGKEARKAIVQPIQESHANIAFEDGALDALLNDLAPDGWVEPVHLQVVCKDLWEELRKQNLTVITKKLLTTSGSAEVALEKYYNAVVHDVAAGEKARKNRTTERQIRDWFGGCLLSGETRLQALKGATHTGTLPNEVVEELDHAHLIRSDTRNKKTWCELTHDRLIHPVTHSNAEWKLANLSVLQRETELWIKGGSSPDRLLRGTLLSDASAWSRQHKDELTPQEREYLRRSRAKARTRFALIMSVAVALALLSTAFLAAEKARQESHLAAVRVSGQQAIQLSADQPVLAAGYALNAEQSHLQGRSVAAKLYDQATGGNTGAAEEMALRGAFLAATVQHDPRYAGAIPYRHNQQDPVCVWYSPDGSRIWAYTFPLMGTMLSTPKHPRDQTQPEAFDASTYQAISQAGAATCPTQGFDQKNPVLFNGPPGWSVLKQPDRIEFYAPKGHTPSAYVGSPASTLAAAAVDPTGRRVAWVTGRDNYVYVMELESRQVTPLPSGDLHETVVQFSPDGNILAAGGTDYLVRLWWFNDSEGLWKAPLADIPMRAHGDTVMSLAFSPEGNRLASQGLDGRIIEWRILPEMAPGNQGIAGAMAPGARLALAPSRDKLVTRSDRGRTASLAEKTIAIEGIEDIFIRRDGRTAVVITGPERDIWQLVDLESGQALANSGHADPIVSFALSDDGKFGAFCKPDGKVDIYSIEGSPPKRQFDLYSAFLNESAKKGLIPDTISVRSVAFLPSGHTLVTGDLLPGHAISVWDLDHPGIREGQIQMRNTPTAMAIAPDGSLGAALDEMNTIRFWDLVSRTIIGGALQMPGGTRSVTFPTNSNGFSGGVLQLPGSPRNIAFSADGRTFYALSGGGSMLSWSIDMGRMRDEACRLLVDAARRAELCGGAK
jgi:WD40 repeat protein